VADPCTPGRISTGNVQTPPLIINGANPTDYANVLVLSPIDRISCGVGAQPVTISAVNTSDKSTSDSVQMCLYIPADLDYTPGSLSFTQPAGFTPDYVTETQTGSVLEVCFDAPALSPGQQFSVGQ